MGGNGNKNLKTKLRKILTEMYNGRGG